MEQYWGIEFRRNMVLVSRTLDLEDRFNEKAFGVAVVSAKCRYFADRAPAWLTLDVDDKCHGFSDLGFDVGEGGLRMIAHHQIGKAPNAFSAELA